jgi:hypothetical protein
MIQTEMLVEISSSISNPASQVTCYKPTARGAIGLMVRALDDFVPIKKPIPAVSVFCRKTLF